MFEVNLVHIWELEILITWVSTGLAVLALVEVTRLRRIKQGEFIYVYYYWFLGALLALTGLRAVSLSLTYALERLALDVIRQKAYPVLEAISNLTFTFLAVVAFTYTYMQEKADEQQKQRSYTKDLERVRQLVLDLAGRAGENVEELPCYDNPHLVKCWEVLRCEQPACELYGQEATRCWHLSPTKRMCLDCQNCQVFALATRDLQSKTGEALNNLFALIEKKREEFGRQNQNYQEMLSFISRDLKTPLAPLHGYASLLRRGFLGSVTPQQQAALEVISRNVKDFQEMITRYLELSTLEHGQLKLVFRPCDMVQEIILPALNNFKESLAEREIQVEFQNESEKDVLLEGDGAILVVIVNNLLSNAIKYGREKSKIVISVRCQQNGFEFRFRNAGGNIPVSMREKIFSKFTRLNETGRSAKIKGTGLGLYNAKKIVELHQGKIWVENQPDVYTEFIFWLPKKQVLGGGYELSPLRDGKRR